MINWQKERNYFRKLYLQMVDKHKNLEQSLMSLPNDIKAQYPDLDKEVIYLLDHHLTQTLEKHHEEN